tara:strand:+ start:24 stop:254 length:231 start_codon:yes stop_codon:yes gene_type:complete
MIGKDSNQNLIYMSIDNIEYIIKAKNKAKKVIESCKNEYHFKSASKFIDLYMNATDDVVGTSELEIQLLDKRKELC